MDAREITGLLRFVERLALLQHLHQELRIGLRLAPLGHDHTACRQQRLGATDGIAHDTPRFVDLDRFAERLATLGRAGRHVPVGVQGTRELAVRLLDRREIEVEPGFQAQ